MPTRSSLQVLTLVALSPLLISCGDDDPVQPTTNLFPLSAENVWVYKTTSLDGNGKPTDRFWYDTARVVGPLTFAGRTGSQIRTGRTITDTSGGSQSTVTEYEIASYAVDGGKVYALFDTDTTELLGRGWFKIADESGTTWTELDTTMVQNAATGQATRVVATVTKGAERTVAVKGEAKVGREYTFAVAYSQMMGATVVSSFTQSAHFWFAHGVGLIAYRADPSIIDGFERVLIDYTVK